MLNKGLNFSFLQLRSRIKFVFDSAKNDTVGTAQSQFFLILKFEFLGENETKFENIVTYWSVAQAGLNDEKSQGVENLVGLSL